MFDKWMTSALAPLDQAVSHIWNVLVLCAGVAACVLILFLVGAFVIFLTAYLKLWVAQPADARRAGILSSNSS